MYRRVACGIALMLAVAAGTAISAQSNQQKQAQQQAARQAQQQAQRQAQEQAARQAREQAARQAREQAARQAREQAARQAREQAARQAREQAAKQAREQAAKQAREQAAKQAREQAAKQAREQAAKQAREQAAKQAREQAAKQAREQAAKQAREQAAKQAREQAAKQAREQAAKQAREQAARQAREQAAKQAREQAARQAREQAGKQAREQASKQAREQAARQAREQAARRARELAAKRSREQALGKLTPAQRQRFDRFEHQLKARQQLNRRPPSVTAARLSARERANLEKLAKNDQTLKGALARLDGKQPLTAKERTALQTALGRSFSPLARNRGPGNLGLSPQALAKLKADPKLKGIVDKLSKNRPLTAKELTTLRNAARTNPAAARLASRAFGLTGAETQALLNGAANPKLKLTPGQRAVLEKAGRGEPLSPTETEMLNGLAQRNDLPPGLRNAAAGAAREARQEANLINNVLPGLLGGLQGGGLSGFISGGGVFPPMPLGPDPGGPTIMPPFPAVIVPNDPNVIEGPGVAVTVLPGPPNFMPGPDPGPGPGPDPGPGPGPEPGPDPTVEFGSLVSTDLPLQTVRTLTVVNNSKERATVYVQYRGLTEDGDWQWFPGKPGGEEALVFELDPGESVLVMDGDWAVRADRVRVWAAGPMTEWNQFQTRDLVLVPEVDDAGTRGYRSLEVQNSVFALR
jgi:hypothetical protein